jgi:hypothetical protein
VPFIEFLLVHANGAKAAMKWLIRNNNHFSAPYRVYHSIQGFDAWIYSKHGAACLGRGLTLNAAQSLCEKHRLQNLQTERTNENAP